MIGMVLAAGAGRRLGGLTDDLPKALLEVAPDQAILDLALANLASVGLRDIAVVTGFASHRIESRKDALQERHGVQIRTIFNEKALDWNNAYSLWLARDYFAEGVLLCNGDTVHPASVERTLLDSTPGDADVVLALDDAKSLAEEEMKVVLDEAGRMKRISKELDPASAAGEYIGLTRLHPDAGADVADALKATWERNTNLYYEDGFQEYVDRGGAVAVAPIGAVSWVEVDTPEDLERARGIACHY